MTPVSIPVTIDPRPTGHTVECEDFDGNYCICGKSNVQEMRRQE